MMSIYKGVLGVLFFSSLALADGAQPMPTDCDYELRTYSRSWCGPCNRQQAAFTAEGMDPSFTLTVLGRTVKVCHVKPEVFPEGITGIPTNDLWQGGRLLKRATGSLSTRDLIEAFVVNGVSSAQ